MDGAVAARGASVGVHLLMAWVCAFLVACRAAPPPDWHEVSDHDAHQIDQGQPEPADPRRP